MTMDEIMLILIVITLLNGIMAGVSIVSMGIILKAYSEIVKVGIFKSKPGPGI